MQTTPLRLEAKRARKQKLTRFPNRYVILIACRRAIGLIKQVFNVELKTQVFIAHFGAVVGKDVCNTVRR